MLVFERYTVALYREIFPHYTTLSHEVAMYFYAPVTIVRGPLCFARPSVCL